MTDSVLIKCSHTSDVLELSEPEGLRQKKGTEYYCASIRGHNLSAFTKVYAFEPHETMTQFFESLAANWAGWRGEKQWSSLEGELSFVCTSDSLGHVALEITLACGLSEDDWSVRKVVHLEAEQLEQVALSIKKFFKG